MMDLINSKSFSAIGSNKISKKTNLIHANHKVYSYQKTVSKLWMFSVGLTQVFLLYIGFNSFKYMTTFLRDIFINLLLNYKLTINLSKS